MRRLLAITFLFFSVVGFSSDFVPSDSELLPILKKKFQGKTDYIERSCERKGNKTLEVSSYISMSADFDMLRKISRDYPHWRDWVMTDFNTPQPNEGEFVLQLHDLVVKTPKKITAVFSFNVPFLKRTRARTFTMSEIDGPKSFAIVGDTVLNEKSAVRSAKAYMKAMKAEGQPGMVWVAVKAIVQFNNWLFYEALPEKILLREIGDRLAYIVRNYEREENRMRDNPAQRINASAKPHSLEGLNEDL